MRGGRGDLCTRGPRQGPSPQHLWVPNPPPAPREGSRGSQGLQRTVPTLLPLFRSPRASPALTGAPCQQPPASSAGAPAGGARTVPPLPAFPGLLAHRPQTKPGPSRTVRTAPAPHCPRSAPSAGTSLLPCMRRRRGPAARGALSNSVRKRACYGKGKGGARERHRPVRQRNLIGRCFPRKSQCPALLAGKGVASLFWLLTFTCGRGQCREMGEPGNPLPRIARL